VTAAVSTAAGNFVAAALWFIAALVCEYWPPSCISGQLGKQLPFVMAAITQAQSQAIKACH